MAWYYTFEVKEIQSFILRSDKLRDMVGGSELVARLCGSFLHDALKAVGIDDPEKVIIANAAGWARMRFDSEERAREFACYWPLMVSRYAPGLKLVQALAPISGTLPEAVNQGIEELRGKRNLHDAELPEIGPLIERNPRTGAAATVMKPDGRLKKPMPLDAQTNRKRECAKNHSSLTGRITSEFDQEAWPYEIDDIASDKSAYVAVIHADGNDLGATLMRINTYLNNSPDDAETIYRELTKVIDETTITAVRSAAETTFLNEYRKRTGDNPGKQKIAARPIILGGDDLTIIVRADLAIEFTKAFLEAFERNSKEMLVELRKKILDIPEILTACAGITFVKKSYPFSSAYQMAESLCGHTKMVAKLDRDSRKTGEEHVPVPSSLTFYRITTSMAEGFGEVKENELTGRGLYQEQPIKFWFGPYAVGDAGGNLPRLDGLIKLVKAIGDLPGGSVRTLIGTMHNEPVTALKDYDRILEVAKKEHGDALKDGLFKLTNNQKIPLWSGEMRTPLVDAHLLREIKKGVADA